MFTFKTVKPTGRYKSFFPEHHLIKLKKVEVGTVSDQEGHKIRFQVIKADINKDGNPNCSWEWITLHKESATVDEAKEFLKTNYEAIIKKYILWKGDGHEGN